VRNAGLAIYPEACTYISVGSAAVATATPTTDVTAAPRSHTSAATLLGYARVSTPTQSTDLQIDALEQAGCWRTWTDIASGANTARPQLGALLEHARPGEVLVVWRLDRLGRSLRELVDLVEQLRTRGIGLRSLHEAIDTTTAAGRLTLHVFAALAEFERSLLTERSRAGLDAARARGHHGGRPTVMTPAKRDAAVKMRAAGTNYADIAAALDVAKTTIRRHLTIV
jgi:DNA invertase Pin-like site-specific DNA recombinase